MSLCYEKRRKISKLGLSIFLEESEQKEIKNIQLVNITFYVIKIVNVINFLFIESILLQHFYFKNLKINQPCIGFIFFNSHVVYPCPIKERNDDLLKDIYS